MDERRMIGSLERVLEDAEGRGLDIGIARSVFDGGEWLLALTGLEIVAAEDAAFGERRGADLRAVREVMGDPPGPLSVMG